MTAQVTNPFDLKIWLLQNTDQLVAASNFTAAILLTIVAIAIFVTLFRVHFSKGTDIFYLLLGVGIEAIGWAVHRLYWGAWRIYRLIGDDKMDAWFVANAYFALIPAVLIFMGLTLIIGPMLSLFMKIKTRFSFVLATMLVIATYWLVYVKLQELDHNYNLVKMHVKPAGEMSEQTINRPGVPQNSIIIKTIPPKVIRKELEKPSQETIIITPVQ